MPGVRDLISKETPVIDVRAYGAVGDGVTNDTAAIQAANDAAEAVNGTVFIPVGTYLFDELTIVAPVSWEGAGWGTVFKANGTSSRILIQDVGRDDEIVGVHLRNFAIDGNNTGVNVSGMIQANDVLFYFERLHIYDCGSGTSPGVNGISCSTATSGPAPGGTVTRCLVERCSKAGINISTRSSGVVISKNTSRYNDSGGGIADGIVGISCDSVDGARIVDNESYGNEGAGFDVNTLAPGGSVEPNKRTVIARNLAYENGDGGGQGHGIHVKNGQGATDDADYGHLVLAFNQCWKNAVGTANSGHGILVENVNNVRVIGNGCWENNSQGMRFNTVTGLVITGNECLDNNEGSFSASGGYYFDDCHNIVMGFNRASDTGSGNQDYGVSINNACTDFLLTLNDLEGNVVAPQTGYVSNTSGFKRIDSNIGYVTESRGLATISNGTTEVTVTHGLALTPDLEDILLTFGENPGLSSFIWVTDVTSTSFKINVDADPGKDLNVVWQASLKV